MKTWLVRASLIGVVACGGDDAMELGLTPEAAEIRVGGSVRFATDRPATFVVHGEGAIGADGRYLGPGSPAHVVIEARSEDGAVAEATVDVIGYDGRLVALPPVAVRAGHTATLLDDGSVLIAGALGHGAAERFVPAAGGFEAAGDLGGSRWQHSAVRLDDGGVLIAGGSDGSRALASASVWRAGAFEPTTGTLGEARFQHRALVLDGGRVLVTGGQPRPGRDVAALASAELYDPASGTFAATGALGDRRSGHTATLLPDGRVLIVGGRDSTCLSACPQVFWRTAELYDPTTGTFAATGVMSIGRADHTATLLPDGRVLVAGGTTPDLENTDIADSIEIYDPATGTFTAAGAMRKQRSEHTATLLGDGRVLFAHGRSEGDGTIATATVEAFDPATGASAMTASEVSTRYRHTATRLDDGTVLVVAGTEGGAGIQTVERYE